MKTPVTAIVLTYNEESNIGKCLASLDWADDVVVLDSGSTDRTLETARLARLDIRVFTHEFKDFGDQRNWAIDNTAPRNEWILFLDADERCTDKCRDAIAAAIASPGTVAGYYMTYRNIFLGRWLKYSTLYPSWQLRLFKRGMVRFVREGHGQKEMADGPLAYIRAPYDHFCMSKGIGEWISRHNRYTSDEIELVDRLRHAAIAPGDLFKGAVNRRRCLKRIAARMTWTRLMVVFPYRYILRGGFLDGLPGLLFCLLLLSVEIQLAVKICEHRFSGNKCCAAGHRPDCAGR